MVKLNTRLLLYCCMTLKWRGFRSHGSGIHHINPSRTDTECTVCFSAHAQHSGLQSNLSRHKDFSQANLFGHELKLSAASKTLLPNHHAKREGTFAPCPAAAGGLRAHSNRCSCRELRRMPAALGFSPEMLSCVG